eukprot:UN23087
MRRASNKLIIDTVSLYSTHYTLTLLYWLILIVICLRLICMGYLLLLLIILSSIWIIMNGRIRTSPILRLLGYHMICGMRTLMGRILLGHLFTIFYCFYCSQPNISVFFIVGLNPVPISILQFKQQFICMIPG